MYLGAYEVRGWGTGRGIRPRPAGGEILKYPLQKRLIRRKSRSKISLLLAQALRRLIQKRRYGKIGRASRRLTVVHSTSSTLSWQQVDVRNLLLLPKKHHLPMNKPKPKLSHKLNN